MSIGKSYLKRKKDNYFSFSRIFSLATGIVPVGNAVAGEKFKCRNVWYTTKWEQINVGDEKDHVISLHESKGIISNMEGKTFGDGWLGWSTGICDISPKNGITANGYLTMTDKDGHMIYVKFEHKPSGPVPWTFFKGTGKFEGIQGKGTCLWFLQPTQSSRVSIGKGKWSYADSPRWEMT